MPQQLQILEPRVIRKVALGKQETLRKIWNERLKSPFAFVPHDELETGKVTVEKAVDENTQFGQFARGYIANVISRLKPMHVEKGLPAIVAPGFGRGYDGDWLEKAALAGFQTCWIDISDVACDFARTNLEIQRQKLATSHQSLQPHYRIIRGELRSILAEPESVDLSIEGVQLWYFCRLLGCLPRNSARMILRQVGNESFSSIADPDCQKTAVIIGTFRDQNPTTVGKTSTLWTKKGILRNLEWGAGRGIRASDEQYHRYFNQTVMAMTIRADRTSG